MSTPAAVLGKYANGTTYGLKTSLPGINALTDDDTDPSKFSFNSEWTDIVRPHQIGIASFPANLTTIFFPGLAFRPFYEVRRVIGSVIYDDRFVGSPQAPWVGMFSDVSTNALTLIAPPGGSAMYVIYNQRAL